MTLNCQHCRADTVGVVLCKRCRITTERALTNVAIHHGELFSIGGDVPKVRRRSGMSDPTGSAASATPKASPSEIAAVETKAMLVGWVRTLIDDRPGLVWPADSVAGTSTFLRQHMRSVVTLEWAGALLDDVQTFERRLQRIVSAGKGHWFAGICGAPLEGSACQADLMVRPGDRFVRCRACGSHWSVEERRAQVIEHAREQLLPVSVIARAAVALLDDEASQQRLENRLAKWVERKVLEDYGVRVLADGRPHRVYRLGDVLDLLVREADRATRTSA